MHNTCRGARADIGTCYETSYINNPTQQSNMSTLSSDVKTVAAQASLQPVSSFGISTLLTPLQEAAVHTDILAIPNCKRYGCIK